MLEGKDCPVCVRKFGHLADCKLVDFIDTVVDFLRETPTAEREEALERIIYKGGLSARKSG